MDYIKLAQRTIAMLSSMIESGECHTTRSREMKDNALNGLEQLRIHDVRQRIIDYTNWLTKQNLMICEGVDGYTFRSSMIGGKKYTAEELYDKFVSEYVA